MVKETAYNGSSEAPAKHRRISRACNFCRSKKIKCDGAEPKCSTCIAHNKSCDYSQRGKKRGVPAGQYQLLLHHQALAEYLLGCLISNLHEAESSVKVALARLEIDDNTDNGLECFRKNWRQCQVYSTFGKLFTELSASPIPSPPEAESLQSKSHPNALRASSVGNKTPVPLPDGETGSSYPSSLIGTRRNPILLYGHNRTGFPASTTNDQGLPPSLTGLDHYSRDHEDASSSLTSYTAQKPPISSTPIYKDGPNIEILLHPWYLSGVKISLDNLRFPEDGDELLDRFFTNTHSFVPLLDKVDVLQFFHNEVNLIAEEKKEVITREKMSIIWSSCSLSSLCSDEAREDLVKYSYAYTMQLISSTKASSISTITRFQSLILFCLNLIRDGAWVKAREVVTLVCDLAIRHRLFDNRALKERIEIASDATYKAGTRIWTSCFLLDTLIASRLSLLPTIRSQSCPIPSIGEDNWEEWDSWTFKNQPEHRKSPARIASTYNQLIRLVHLFNSYLSTITFYGAEQDVGRNDTNIEAAITAYTSLSMNMQTWVDGLPEYLRKDMIWTDNHIAETSFHVSTPYIIGLNMVYHSLICFSCNKIMAYGGPPRSQKPNASVIDTASHRLAVSSACNKRLFTLYSTEYGSTSAHPFMLLIIQLSSSSNPTIHSSNKTGNHDHGMNTPFFPATFTEGYLTEGNTQCKALLHQGDPQQATRGREKSLYDIVNHNTDEKTSNISNTSGIPILENCQEQVEPFETSQQNIDLVDNLDSSQFTAGAEIGSSELLDYSRYVSWNIVNGARL